MNVTEVCPGPFVDPPTCEMAAAQFWSPSYDVATVVALLNGMFIFLGGSTYIVLTLMTTPSKVLRLKTVKDALLLALMGVCQILEAGNYLDMRYGLHRLTSVARWTSIGIVQYMIRR